MTVYSYQLYSSREFPPLAETLKMLAATGYRQVEGFGGLYEDLPTLASALKATGLTMPTGHFGLDMLEHEPARVLEIAESVDMKAIYCPHLSEELRPEDSAGWRAFGERLQTVGAKFRDKGYIFGWHNHDFEFRTMTDGSLPMDEIFLGGPELSWEADLAWIVRGSGDPMDWIARHGNRITAVHIKDIAPDGECEDEDGWADVGQGTMNWNALLAAVKNTTAQYYIMEHDKPNDDGRFAKRSFAGVKSLMEA